MDTWWVAGVLGVALILGGEVTNAAEVPVSGAVEEETFDFDIPALPLRGAAEAFARRIGRDTYIGHEAFDACGNFVLKPLAGRLTAQEAWRRLTEPICASSGVVVEAPGDGPVYMVDHPWVAARKLRIPRSRLIDALRTLSTQFDGLQLEYRAKNVEEGQRLVGPIAGTMDPEEALRRIEGQLESSLHHLRAGPFAFLIEPSGRDPSYGRRYLYGRTCSCPVRIEDVPSETVTVVKPALFHHKSGGVVSFTREQIESTGASSLPQFFRYLAQNSYSRPEGYIASGAQYADFRGLGRDTHLVTINGHRTLPSANNITSSAFDLNTIPLPAVDHVTIRVDSASMRSGSDAIAGTIDIVTRRELKGEAELRYGLASGGAEERRTTLSAGHQASAGSVAALFDYFETGDLLGVERPLSRDQDYSRYGGTDYRAAFAITSLDGTSLPGLRTPLAGMPSSRQSDQVTIAQLIPGEPERVSLSRYQSLVPATTRASIVGAADYAWRGVELAADVLWVKRDAAYRYYPAIASGIVSADHPGNPFDQPVRIDALLTGAPSMQQHVESELRRAVLSARGRLRDWRWDVAVIGSNETAQAWLDHRLDPARTAEALLAGQERSALDVFAMRPGGPEAPEAIWAEASRQRFSSAGGHLFGGIEGPIGASRLQLGLERRTEEMQFNASVGRVEREVRGGFAHLTLPLVDPRMNVFGMKRLTTFAGVRRDAFSDSQSITRTHFEIEWKLTDRFGLDANLATQYRPPSLFELNLPRVTVPIQIYDPRRDEAVATLLIAGGNPNLRPTTGKSTHVQATYASPEGFTASLNYFSIRLWDRIAALPIPVLLAGEDRMTGRVERDPTAEEIAAGRAGRLVSVNTTRDNVGRLLTRGIDASVRTTFDVRIGTLTPRMDLTWIDSFRYSDSAAGSSAMTDRVGVASEQGTVTRWRAVLSLGWQGQAWAATTYLRLIPAYEDVNGGRIGSQQLVDLNVSYAPSRHVKFTLGAMDLANTSPHFARVGAATGYDSSQWDPVGRRIMLTARVSL